MCLIPQINPKGIGIIIMTNELAKEVQNVFEKYSATLQASEYNTLEDVFEDMSIFIEDCDEELELESEESGKEFILNDQIRYYHIMIDLLPIAQKFNIDVYFQVNYSI